MFIFIKEQHIIRLRLQLILQNAQLIVRWPPPVTKTKKKTQFVMLHSVNS